MNKPMVKQGDFCWNELMTPDVEKAKAFYKSLFGWEYQEHEMESGAKYTMIKSANCGSGGIMQAPEDKAGQIPPHWMSYIYVDNLNASIEKAKSLGATIKVPATQAGEFGHFAIIIDPTGAHIALWHSAEA